MAALRPSLPAALRKWFAQFADWLAGSANGKLEAASKNNHGTWYDTQLVDFALYGGRIDLGAYGDTPQASQSRASFLALDYPNGYTDWEATACHSILWHSYNVSGKIETSR